MYYHCIVESLYILMRVAVIITSSQREPFWALLFFTGPTGLVLGGSSMLQLECTSMLVYFNLF